MSLNTKDLVYIKPEERIYDVAINKDLIDWKSFLYELIYNEGLDPWDIDLAILTKKYIESLKKLKEVDFDISGKFLTIAVFLLKTKTQALLEKDIRGIENKIASIQQSSDGIEELDSLEEIDGVLDEHDFKKKKSSYTIKYRNPIARKRKVTIFDLIKTLEKTIEQSNRRRSNFFQRQGNSNYDGPMYDKKPKDLKQLIDDLHNLILSEISDKKGHVTFSHIVRDSNHKMGVLEKFIPLLHLHNQSKVHIDQENHFGDIKIHKK
jgi:chromatin segregation and condensation protein Rec8/ScpA/Scc1 (kleisin family)